MNPINETKPNWIYPAVFYGVLAVVGWIVFRAIVMLALGAVCPC